MSALLIKNIGMLATPTGSNVKKGKEQGETNITENTAIVVKDGIIAYVGKENDAPCADKTIDAKGLLVTPGLVDCHTHLVFGGWRQNEMELKLKGVSYLDILKSGGGILSTVRSTREASKEELIHKAQSILKDMAAHGTTSVEAKSGYGLNIETEIKQLEVAKHLQETSPLDIVSTFMGAHAIPEEYKEKPDEYVDFVCNEMIPIVVSKNLAQFCDIFCETAVFTMEQSKKILETAKKYGLDIKIHADEIDPIGGAELAGQLQALSAEHLIAATDEGIKSMARGGTIAVLLPATSFYLDKGFARARDMIKANIPVAIASDFNPGSSPNFNMQFPMNLACMRYKMTPEEALTAVTLNAACAMKKEKIIGSIETGKQGDIVIWNCPDLNSLFYRYGNNQVNQVIKKGNIL